MKYMKNLLILSAIIAICSAVYAGDKQCKAEKKWSTAVKACKNVNDSNAVKQCAEKRKNAEKCNAQAASKGQKKGWFSFLKKDKKAAAAETKVGAKKQGCPKKEGCRKAGLKKCKPAEPNQPTDPNTPKCISKICKKAEMIKQAQTANK